MKKTILLSFLLFLFSLPKSFGQIENLSEDTVKTLLCHKWGVKAMYMGGQEINSSGETVTYEFRNDNTFTRVTDKKTDKGTWVFEPGKRVVHLAIRKKTNLYITSLKASEFELATKDLEENNPLSIKIIFKPVAE